MPTREEPQKALNPLADADVRRMLEDYVRRRVPASDVDDVVQTVLLDALSSPSVPGDATELRKWLLGIARHKVVDHHRRVTREPTAELVELEAHAPPYEERALAEWAEKQAGPEGDAKKTLAWMAREGEGEKLESIAAEENVPATRVRQRVSRMRRWMKERWLSELAAVAALCALAFVLWRIFKKPEEVPQALPDKPGPSVVPPEPSPLERARAMREDALRKCDSADYRACLDGLDEAAKLDPAGDAEPKVRDARERADKALNAPPPVQSSAPLPAPTVSAVPAPISTPPTTSDEKSKPVPTTLQKTSPTSTPPSVTPKPVKPSFDFGSKKSGKTSSSIDFDGMKK